MIGHAVGTARASDESNELRWFELQEALAADTDESARRLTRLVRAESR